MLTQAATSVRLWKKRPCTIMCWYCWHRAKHTICLLSPLLCPPPPPRPSQSALHWLSLRACHPYGISEAGAKHPLPLSLLILLPLFTPLFPRPLHQFTEGSRWYHVSLSDRRLKTKKQQWKQNKSLRKKDERWHFTRNQLSDAHRLCVWLLFLMISLQLDDCCSLSKNQKSKPSLHRGTSMLAVLTEHGCVS